MNDNVSKLYLDFDQHRKREEAHAADRADEIDLKALELKLKKHKH